MKTKNYCMMIFIFLLGIVGFMACNNDSDKWGDTYEGDTHIVAKGVLKDDVDLQTKSIGLPVDDTPVAFTGKDILWFNSKTREIKFKDIEPVNLLSTYQKVHFELDNSYLFTAILTTGIQSFAYPDLVLYFDLATKKYYLADGYPDFMAKSDEAKANAAGRAQAWEQFISQLKFEGRLKK